MNIKGLASAFLVALLSTPAAAAVYTLNISGVIASGYDRGYLGGQGELSGQLFTSTFRVDDQILSDDAITWTFSTGGVTIEYKPPSKLVAVSPAEYYVYRNEPYSYGYYDDGAFYIGRGHYYSDNVYDSGENFIDVYQQQFLTLDFTIENALGLRVPGKPYPKDLHIGPETKLTGFLSIGFDNAFYNEPRFRDALYADLVGTSYSLSVPEPATWALLVLGLGSAGAILRRKRAFA